MRYIVWIQPLELSTYTMKNLFPSGSASTLKEKHVTPYVRERYHSPPDGGITGNYARELLSKYLSKARNSGLNDFGISRISKIPDPETTIREAAYYRYLERLKKSIPGSPEEDWKYAKAALKN